MGEFKVDPATIAFRLALAEASEQEQARADALLAFWQRAIFVATWPSPNEAPRTLTNSQGETALPLFTGLDTLELGADRFSWREPNGSIRFREMSAKEAFRYALARQVNFVVVDVGFEHNVEFAREEFESLVLQKEAQAAASSRPADPQSRAESGQYMQAAASHGAQAATPQSAKPPSASGQVPQRSVAATENPQPPRHRSEPGRYAQGGPADHAQPPAFAKSSERVPVQQPPQPPRHRSEPGQYAQAAGIAGSQASRQPVYAQGTQRAQPAQNAPATPLRAAARAIPQQPTRASSSMPPSDPMAPKHPSSVPPSLPLGAPIHDVQVSPRLQSGAVPIQQPVHQEAAPRQRSGAVPIQAPPSVRPEATEPNPEPRAPAPPQRTVSVPPRRRTISASPPPPSAYPPNPAETASTIPPQPSAADRPTAAPPSRAAAAQGQTHPGASFVPRAHSQTAPIHTPKTPTPAPQMSPPRAAGELRRTPPPVPEAAKSKTPSSPGVPAPIVDARPANDNKPPEMRRRARDDEPTLAERPNRANTQRGLQASVPDAALEALSSELRGFPEVEWACVLADESDVPLIGVRVDPSFLNRVADITDVIMDVGERQSVALQVLLLNNQDQVKNARRNGRAFYPWTAPGR